MTISLFATAFMLGLLGSGHCIAMCGGVASSLQIASKGDKNMRVLQYNFGRLLCYAVTGFLVALFGAALASQHHVMSFILKCVSALLMIGLGIYIMRLFNPLALFERLGKWALWQHAVKLNRYLMPVDSGVKAIGYGALWGFLPCGLVYTALTWTFTLEHPLYGAAFMACFALGTFPSLMLVGHSAERARAWLNHTWLRLVLGNLFIWLGFYQLIVALRLTGL